MNTGKLTRLNRLFSHPSGRLCSVAADHFMGYDAGLPPGLRHIRATLAAVVAGRPDAVTLHKGIAASVWAAWAGHLPLILQSTAARPDDSACEQIAVPEDAVRLGADGFAVAAFVRGPTEAAHLRVVADCVRQAAAYEMPVICHVYPRAYADGQVAISYAAEDIAWAVRGAVECGVDVVKTPYCGQVQAFAEIVADCPVPLVIAGGPQSRSLESALAMVAEAMGSGARGATIGRNVWGLERVTEAVNAFKGVIHDGLTPEDALRAAGW
jgi:class I fructose-bisphosphate aldolase